MKLYNKPELNVEVFDVEDVITNSGVESDNIGDDLGPLSAGIEFNVAANGNDEF